MSDVKYRYRDDCEHLLAASPMLSIKLPVRKLNKPVMVQLPVPPNPNKKQRPTTAVERDDKPSSRNKARPTSAFMPSFKKDGKFDAFMPASIMMVSLEAKKVAQQTSRTA